jgi:ribosome-associated protein
MQQLSFTIKGDFIQLIKLLKVTGVADSGVDAKILVEEEKVSVNGALELRKRAKICPGDKVTVDDISIVVA